MILREGDRGRRRRAGFTLMEMVVVMWGMGIALAMGLALIFTTASTNRVGSVAADRIGHRSELARQLRRDVGRAETTLDRIDDFKASDACLILRMPGGSVIVYQWRGKALERREKVGGKERVQILPIAPRETETKVVFIRPAASTGVVTLRVTERKPHGPEDVSELSAALGGILR